VPGWHRLSYATTDGLYQSVELENHIRQLHRAVGNAVVDDKTLVLGAGSTQLINALVHALSPDADADASPPARVVATVPYYPVRHPIQSRTMSMHAHRWSAKCSENRKDIVIGVLYTKSLIALLMDAWFSRTEHRQRCSTAASTDGKEPRLHGPTRHETPATAAGSSSSSRRRTTPMPCSASPFSGAPR